MYPQALVTAALKAGLDIIGICDHNAADNARYVIKAARKTGLTVFPGMEITSREEVHILSLFENLEPLLALQEIVTTALPGTNDEAAFGCQAIVNEDDEVEGISERLLIGSTTLPLEMIVDTIHKLGGMAIAAHIDRDSFGIIGQLGFVPEDLPLDALEVSFRTKLNHVREQFPELARYSFVTSSDAHRINDIGRAFTTFELEQATIPEFMLGLKGRNGRRIMD